MGSIRKKYSSAFKTKVAVETIKGEKTLTELSSQYGVHSEQLRRWKSLVINGIPELFTNNNGKANKERDALIEELYKKIGQLEVELDWLKKKSGISAKGEGFAYRL